MKKNINDLIDELAEQQREKLYLCGQRLVPGLTKEDLLQPNDYFELEYHPQFRYEEGLLHGILAAKTALNAEMIL